MIFVVSLLLAALVAGWALGKGVSVPTLDLTRWRVRWWRMAGFAVTLTVVSLALPRETPMWLRFLVSFVIGFCYPSVIDRTPHRLTHLG